MAKSSKEKECPADKILNPKTKRCVKKTGAIGKRLLLKAPPKVLPNAPPKALPNAPPKQIKKIKTCPPDKVLNPDSKRCVKKTGALGKKILAAVIALPSAQTKHSKQVKSKQNQQIKSKQVKSKEKQQSKSKQVKSKQNQQIKSKQVKLKKNTKSKVKKSIVSNLTVSKGKQKFTNNIYKPPKEPEIATHIPPSPDDATFRNFIVAAIPELNYITVSNMKTLTDTDKLHKYHTISGASPRNVIGRLAAVIGPNYHKFLTQGPPLSSVITQEAHEKLRIIFDALQNHPRKKILIGQLLEGSKACINGIIQVINTVYNEINVVDSLENQILTLLENAKEFALDEFIVKRHPKSNKPSVLNNINKASEQFAHLRNAYVKLLGHELGLRKSNIRLAKTDKYANEKYTISKDVALKEIKAKIKLKDFVNTIINDVNNEVCSIPHTIDRVKLTNWAYNIEYSGDTFDGKNYPQIDGFTDNYLWDESTKNKFPSEPKDKNLAWLSKDSALKMLELEGFVTKK